MNTLQCITQQKIGKEASLLGFKGEASIMIVLYKNRKTYMKIWIKEVNLPGVLK